MNNRQINKEFYCDFEEIIKQTLVPNFSADIARPCSNEDFQDFRIVLKKNISTIDSFLKVIIESEEQLTLATIKCLFKIIVIIGEQHCKKVWNTTEIVEASKLLISKICRIFKSQNVTQILKNDDIFLLIIKFLRPKLLKDTWKTFPASVVCYKWILEMAEKPLIKYHVSEVLPTALLIFDDYVEENQILGLKCLNLIIEHCDKSRVLKTYNYDEVIIEALKKMAYKVESKMIILLYTCISNLLQNIQYYNCDASIFGWSMGDDILIILLGNMELQSNYQTRYAYVISLTKLLIDGNCGKWAERISRIVSEYCEDDTDLKTTSASLDLMDKFLLIYQPVGLNCYTIMYSSLLKLRHKLVIHKKSTKELIDKTDQCISILNKLCPSIAKNILQNETVQLIMNKV